LADFALLPFASAGMTGGVGAVELGEALFVVLGNGLGFGPASWVHPATRTDTETATAASTATRLRDTSRPPRTSTRATVGQTGHGLSST
jgi:hypothetical protein